VLCLVTVDRLCPCLALSNLISSCANLSYELAFSYLYLIVYLSCLCLVFFLHFFCLSLALLLTLVFICRAAMATVSEQIAELSSLKEQFHAGKGWVRACLVFLFFFRFDFLVLSGVMLSFVAVLCRAELCCVALCCVVLRCLACLVLLA
jgi:hypothetical protein